MKSKIIFTLALFSSLLSLQLAAYPVNHGGAECSATSSYSDELIKSAGRLLNNSTTRWAYVTCPVPKDEFSDWALTAAIESAWVRVMDRTPLRRVSCSLTALAIDEHGGWHSQTRSDATTDPDAGTHIRTLNFSWVRQASYDQIAQYYVTCSIPPRDPSLGASGIVDYRINQ